MNTFLPYPDFTQSARVLDNSRLGKQRVECLQILRALLGESQGWRNHPATRMWCNAERGLCLYALAVCGEWRDRGFKDTVEGKVRQLMEEGAVPLSYAVPRWLGREDFHAAHRSNLLRKDPVWYGQWGWAEPPDLPYVWPV